MRLSFTLDECTTVINNELINLIIDAVKIVRSSMSINN